MAVSVDALCLARTTTGSGTSLSSTNLTVGAGATALLVFLTNTTAATSNVTCTWDSGASNQACTSLAVQTATSVYLQMFGLLNPVAGAKTLHLAWTTSSGAEIYSLSLKGNNTASIAAAFTGAQQVTASSSSVSVTVPGAVGDMSFAAFTDNFATPVTLTAAGSTNLFTSNVITAWILSRAPGASPSVAWTGNPGGTGSWAAVGINVAALATQQPFRQQAQMLPIMAQ
jgi:hypothetical protein